MGIANLQLLKMEFSESVFGVENSSHSWSDVRAVNVALTRDQQVHRRQHRVQRLTMHPGNVLGRRSGKLGFSVDLVGDGTALVSSTSPSDDSLQKLLKRTLGGSAVAAGSAIGTGQTSKSVLKLGAAHGSRFPAGCLVMIEGTGASGVNEIRPVASAGTSEIKLEIETTNTASSGANVWNSYSAYVDPSATETCQAQVIGDESGDVYLALGLAGGLGFENLLQLEDVARATLDLFVTRWETDTAPIAAGTYDGASPLGTAEEMEIHWQTHGTTTVNKINCSALEVDPGITWTPFVARGSDDREHVGEIVMTGVAPTVTFTADNDSTFLTIFNAQTAKMMLITFGRTAGSSWAIWLPKLVIAPSVPTREAHAEQTAMAVSCEALENDAASTDLGRSPIVVARF